MSYPDMAEGEKNMKMSKKQIESAITFEEWLLGCAILVAIIVVASLPMINGAVAVFCYDIEGHLGYSLPATGLLILIFVAAYGLMNYTRNFINFLKKGYPATNSLRRKALKKVGR